jgi:predicted RND superfamily exporter protein
LADLVRSFGTAIIIITVIMMLLLRDTKLALLSMIPNLLPIASMLGLMGFLSIPLDVNNVLLGSVAIGIAVDDTVHFIYQYQAHYRDHHDVEQAIQYAFDHTGRAMVATSIILVLGFMSALSVELLSIQRWGKLISSTVALALFCDLLFVPALLRLFYRSNSA